MKQCVKMKKMKWEHIYKIITLSVCRDFHGPWNIIWSVELVVVYHQEIIFSAGYSMEQDTVHRKFHVS